MDIINYKIIITPTAYREMNRIYEYINEVLNAENASKRLMQKIKKKIKNLKILPKIYGKIQKIDEVHRVYRKIVVDNFVILYTVDDEKVMVYISNMYYIGQNYLK